MEEQSARLAAQGTVGFIQKWPNSQQSPGD